MFYKSIAKVYDYIFPKNRKQLDFIESIKKIEKDEKILDIGCATGNLTSLLLEKTVNCEAIDLDEELLYMAKNKNINAKKLNMLHIDEEFSEGSFDRVISFGNTIVHLDSREEIELFFQKVYKVLKNNGKFIVQIINYDRIINKNIKALPTIDNEVIKFIREYKLTENKLKVEFITELTIKNEGQIIKNSINLLALKKDEIKTILEKVGFKNLEFYGNFNGDLLNDDCEALIFVANKKEN